ncbi:MAG: peptide deformylase [Endomicrobium sp.]|jgi:peptide deformylase|nr:peptide deformylase [Endomicrobium sp.]
MAMLEIKKYGDSVLRKKSDFVRKISKDIKNLSEDMFETMYSLRGLGLAAPQVGFFLRVCTVDVDPDKKSPLVMVNPKIISGSDKVLEQEGCLSLPNIFAKVKRFSNTVTEYMDLEGKCKTIEAEGLLARAIQHEIDHLDAKIFIDYLPAWKRKNIEKEIKRRRKKGDW